MDDNSHHNESELNHYKQQLAVLKSQKKLENAEKITEPESAILSEKKEVSKEPYEEELERDYELIDKVLTKQQENMESWTPYFKHLILWQVITIYGIVVLNGFNIFGFKIDNSILALLITGLFAETIGIVAVMIKYIFSNQVALLHKNRKDKS
jgi:hypothetical protein